MQTNATTFTYPSEKEGRPSIPHPDIIKPIVAGKEIANPKPEAVATALFIGILHKNLRL